MGIDKLYLVEVKEHTGEANFVELNQDKRYEIQFDKKFGKFVVSEIDKIHKM